MPPIEEYEQMLAGIWKRQWLTNNGPLVNELELRLKRYLGVDHLLFLGNGTIALQIAIKSLELSGEIITTPFSYVATTSAIAWEGLKPVHVDIDESTFNIDPSKIEEAITPKTSAILATHCFGNACDIDAIQEIADQHNLKVIYDAAHCFGSKYRGKSLLEFGDISTISFHATKLFHTIEGGAVVTKDPELLKEMAFKRNFGHNGPDVFQGMGINGKNSEFHAAMGLVNLEHIGAVLQSRKEQSEYYTKALKNLDVKTLKIESNCDFNYAYYPILFNSESDLLKAENELSIRKIFPRRYFYPTLSSLDYVEDAKDTPIANDISRRVLCLPLYFELGKEEQDMIARILLRTQNYG